MSLALPQPHQHPSSTEVPHVLVVGIDGSGKSTFLDNLKDTFGYTKLEPTSTPEAKAFKAAHISTGVDPIFVSEREALFLGLNRAFDTQVQDEIERTGNVATTGNALVTLLSHAVMRKVIGAPECNTVRDIVETWVRDQHARPDGLVFVHAPDSVILKRIEERQQRGNAIEKFWGFNAPLFLCQYQDSWGEALEHIQRATDIATVDFDTGTMRVPAMIRGFQQSILSRGARGVV